MPPIPDDDMPPIPDDDMPPIPDDDMPPIPDDNMPPFPEDPSTDIPDDNMPPIPDDPLPPVDFLGHCDQFNDSTLSRREQRSGCNGDRYPAGSESRVCMWKKGQCQQIQYAVADILTRWMMTRNGEKRIGQWCGQWTSTDPEQCDGSNSRQCRGGSAKPFCQWKKNECRKKNVGRLFDMMISEHQQLTRDSFCNTAARRADEVLV
jgi:hypothetical protein